MIPQLHLVTNDDVLRQPNFVATAIDLLLVLQRRVALHIRAKQLPASRLFQITRELSEKAEFVGALLVVNDRVDIALTAGARGVQLGAASLPVATVRAMAGTRLPIGYSAHSAEEAAAAEREGADFLFAGSIYESASHPGAPAGGLPLLNACVNACSNPVLAIGGITAERVPEVIRTGAYGVAMISAVWHASDPVLAADQIANLLG